MDVNITLAIVIITCLVSIPAFSSQKMIDDLIFYPPAIYRRNQWYRFFTCGFIHADWMHLAFNMYAFYAFGNYIEGAFVQLFGGVGRLIYIILYITSLFFCLLPTYIKHRDNAYYRSLGASGAVSAIVFVFIFLFPTEGIGLIFIPGLHIPGFIFGIIYLIISSVLAKRGGSHINHSAHFWGAVYGIVFTVIAAFALTPHNLPQLFLQQVQDYFSSF
jgi:membrane associated rhomboid family serine protease